MSDEYETLAGLMEAATREFKDRSKRNPNELEVGRLEAGVYYVQLLRAIEKLEREVKRNTELVGLLTSLIGGTK